MVFSQFAPEVNLSLLGQSAPTVTVLKVALGKEELGEQLSQEKVP
jgi:hypothetical protein